MEYKRADGPDMGCKPDGSSIYKRAHPGADWQYCWPATDDCLYCGAEIDADVCAIVPAHHGADCDWIATRAHRRDKQPQDDKE